MNVPLADKEIGMLKFDYPEDYTGKNLDHRKISEKRKLTDATSRLVTLDFGAFFAESLVIRNVATARPLTPGKDYACVELDTLATKRSGKQVCTAILIENKQVVDIEIDYIFVGGQHMSGLHLIKELKSIYPTGLKPRYEYDKVLNKPETYKPKEHTTHVKELYGFDGINRSLQEMIDGLGYKDNQYINITFSKVMAILNDMNVQLNEFIADTEESLTQAFEDFRVQDNEFIFTNTKENPVIKRGYGTWVLVSNTVLKGDNDSGAYAIGADSVISLGTKQIVTNCYVWKNQNSSKSPTFTIQAPTHAGLASTQRNENQDIVFNISTTNLAAGSKIAWVILDDVTKKVINPNLLFGASVGEAVTDAQGKASVIVKFRPNTFTAQANRKYVFRLLRNASSAYTFTVMDTSLEKRIELAFTVDAAGKFPISKVNENQEFFLQIKYIGNWTQGEVVFFNWNASGIPFAKLTGAPLTGVVPSSPSETYSLKVQANSLTDNKQALVVYALQDLKDVINSDKPHAEIEIVDSSRFSYAGVSFDDVSTNKTNVVRIDEDVNFDIVIETNLPNTELNLVYNTTKSISDFSGLRSTVTTNSQGKATVRASTLADFLTNIGAQSFTVSVELNNTIIGYNTLFINDTSKTPDYQTFFSKENVSEVITSINEGEKFFLNIKVPGWKTGVKSPSLEFNYTLDEVNNTSLDSLKARILSTFYPAMLFDQSSQTYNEVTWVNGDTLRMEFTAIADKVVKGDTKFGVMVKQSNQSQYDKVAYLTIYDTSIPTVVGTWSSSASVLTPITQVNEMQTNGTNQRCYLWIDIDGDGASFGNITLKSNSVNGVDFVTLFPNTIKLANGASRHIVTVDAKADFIAEGNKDLYVSGSYKNDRGQDVELFRSSITLVDNSILTELNGATSTSASVVVGGNGFSEWVPFYIHMDYPAFAFDTQIEWQATFTSNPSSNPQLEVTSGTIDVPRNTAKNVFTLTPIKDRIQDGEAIFNLSFKRKIKATRQYITADKQITGIKILDDSLPMSVELKMYTDVARTIPVGHTVNEGTKVYLRAVVSNPDTNYAVCFGVQHQTATQISIGGAGTTLALPNTAVPSRITIDDRKITGLVPATPGASTVNIDAEMTVVADRTTKNNGTIFPDGVGIEVRVYDNSNNAYPVGTVVPFDSTATAVSKSAIAFNDTSKTAAYNVITPSSVNEDTAFKLFLEVADGTVGDVYYPVLISGINANRLSINELGLEQLASTAISSHSWNFKVAPDYKTTGPLNLVFAFVNKSIGKQVATKTVVLNDTTTEPDLSLTIGDANDVVWSLSSMVEGTNHQVRVHATNEQLYAGDTIKIEWVSGRPASEFNGLFGSHVLTKDNLMVIKTASLKQDRLTNPVGENVVVVKVTSVFSGTSKNFTVNLVDASKTPTIIGVQWVNPTTNAVITSVREGEKAGLRVTTTGGTHAFNLTLNNDGGRSVGRLNGNDYGVTRTHLTDNNVLLWNFDIKLDNLSNVGNETKLKVRLTSPDTGVTLNQVYELPIVDNSSNTTVDFKVVKNDGSTDAVSYLEEGVSYKLIAGTAAPSDSEYYTLKWGHNTHYFTGAASNYELTEVSDGSYINFPEATFILNDINRTASDKLWFKATVSMDDDGRVVATFNLPVIDNKVPLVTAKITNITDINTAISSVDEGNTVKLVVDPNLLAGVNWSYGTNHRIKWTVVNSGDESATVDRVNNTTGYITQANLSNFNGGYGFQADLGILANEITNSTNNSIKVILVEEYVVGGVTQYVRMGQTGNLTIKDTSPLPSIDSVYFSSSSAVGAVAVSEVNEGDSVYIQVVATGLTPDGSDTTMSFTYSGTEYDGGDGGGDIVGSLPVSVNMVMTDSANRIYKGVAGPITFVEDNVIG